MGALVLFFTPCAYAGGSTGAGGMDDGAGPGATGGGGPCTAGQVIDPNNPDEVECDPVETESYTYPDGYVGLVEKGVVVLSFAPGTPENAIQDLYARHNLTERDRYPDIAASVVLLPEGVTVQDAIPVLAAEPIVDAADPNQEGFFAQGGYFPNDPLLLGAACDPDCPIVPPGCVLGQGQPENCNIEAEIDSVANRGKVNQWYLIKMSAHKAWKWLRDRGHLESQQVKVAVVDSGVDRFRTDTGYAGHPDFGPPGAGNMVHLKGVSAGRSYGKGTVCADNRGFVPSPGYYLTDPAGGHGTSTAGIISAASDNLLGIAGGALKYSKLIAVQVRRDKYWLTSAINGLYKLRETSCHPDTKVINMSWGFPNPSEALERVLNLWYFFDFAILVASAHNYDCETRPYYPAAYPTTIGVAGLSRLDWKAKNYLTPCQHGTPNMSGSNFGTWVGVSAYYGGPDGVNDLSSYYQWVLTLDMVDESPSQPLGYAYGDYNPSYGGTSAAAPMVSALGVLLKVAYPNQTALQYKRAIMKWGDHIPDIRYPPVGCNRWEDPACRLPVRVNYYKSLLFFE